MDKLFLVLILVLITAGCASHAPAKFIAFPMHAQDATQQTLDQMECDTFARQQFTPEADAGVKGAAMGLLAGVTVGAAYGALVGAMGGWHAGYVGAAPGAVIGLAIGGFVGLLVGAVGGIENNTDRYYKIYSACVEARGYKVGG